MASSRFVFLGPQGRYLFLGFVAVVGSAFVEVAPGAHPWHVVHGAGHGGLNAWVVGGDVEGNATPSADTDDADACGVHLIEVAQIVNGGLEVLGVNVERIDIAWFATALARERRVEGDGKESTLGHGLRVEAAGLFLDGSEGTTHSDGRELAVGSLGNIQVGSEGDAEVVVKRNLLVINFVAEGERLVPLLCHIQFSVHIMVVCFLCACSDECREKDPC